MAVYNDDGDCRKVKRGLRQLVAYGEVDIHFSIVKKGGLMGGFTPCYRAKQDTKIGN